MPQKRFLFILVGRGFDDAASGTNRNAYFRIAIKKKHDKSWVPKICYLKRYKYLTGWYKGTVKSCLFMYRYSVN